MAKGANCSFKNMCEDPDKKFLCCYYCDTKRCKYRCKDSVQRCTYKLPENQLPPSGISLGLGPKVKY